MPHCNNIEFVIHTFFDSTPILKIAPHPFEFACQKSKNLSPSLMEKILWSTMYVNIHKWTYQIYLEAYWPQLVSLVFLVFVSLVNEDIYLL